MRERIDDYGFGSFMTADAINAAEERAEEEDQRLQRRRVTPNQRVTEANLQSQTGWYSSFAYACYLSRQSCGTYAW